MSINLDGQQVRVIYDITTCNDDGEEIVIPSGTEFIWDDLTTDQVIDGELFLIEPDEVEAVN